jgi:hypothetical protein
MKKLKFFREIINFTIEQLGSIPLSKYPKRQGQLGGEEVFLFYP